MFPEKNEVVSAYSPEYHLPSDSLLTKYPRWRLPAFHFQRRFLRSNRLRCARCQAVLLPVRGCLTPLHGHVPPILRPEALTSLQPAPVEAKESELAAVFVFDNSPVA